MKVKSNPPDTFWGKEKQTTLRGFARPPLMFAANQFAGFFADHAAPKGGQGAAIWLSCPPLGIQIPEINPTTQRVTCIRGGYTEVVEVDCTNKLRSLIGGVNVSPGGWP